MTFIKKSFSTSYGSYYIGDATTGLTQKVDFHGQVNLIITSPPFPLNNKKEYGNLTGDQYKEWFKSLGTLFEKLLREDGSVVIELGNAWEPGRPVQSLLPYEALLGLVNDSNLRLIQEFICYNPSKLPSPAQWVNLERIRAVDSYTRIWWLAKKDYPKADNRKVLRPYSKKMRKLLRKQQYNSGRRPSEHNISEDGFLTDNGGSISHNFFEIEQIDGDREVRLPYTVLSFANSKSNSEFQKKCRNKDIKPHSARMNPGVASFFIKFLTDQCDTVLDPFAGSNTTGEVAESLERKWASVEIEEEYEIQAKLRLNVE
jgi:site-specific DNA-methyltransferase (cytosine-N4-specific)